MKDRILAGVAIAALSSSISLAQSEDVFDIQKVLCAEVNEISEEEAAYTMVFAYGYLAGKKSADEQAPTEIERRVTAAQASCEATPDQSVLNALDAAW